jgi:hypothetical protein
MAYKMWSVRKWLCLEEESRVWIIGKSYKLYIPAYFDAEDEFRLRAGNFQRYTIFAIYVLIMLHFSPYLLI